jgi:phage gpG-like protein
MAQLEVTFDELARRLEAAAGAAARVDFTEPLKVCKQLIVSDVKRNFYEGHSPDGEPWLPLRRPRPNSKGGDKPLLNTAILEGSVTGRGPGHVERLTPTSLEVGTNHEAAALHQHGGTVRPRNAKALALPLTKEAARAGRARDFPGGLFVLKSKGAHAFLAERRGKGKREKLTLHFILLASVTVPARPFLGIGERLRGRCEDVLAKHAADAFGSL